MCAACKDNSRFYNHEFLTCQYCSKRIEGCKKCVKESFTDDLVKCTKCDSGYNNHDDKCTHCL